MGVSSVEGFKKASESFATQMHPVRFYRPRYLTLQHYIVHFTIPSCHISISQQPSFLLLFRPEHVLCVCRAEQLRFDGVVLVVLLVYVAGPNLRPSVLAHVIHCAGSTRTHTAHTVISRSNLA